MEGDAYTVPNNTEPAAGGGGTPPSGGGGTGEVSNGDNVNGSIPIKRKRGRPKKLPGVAQPVVEVSSPILGFPSPNLTQPRPKRGRGRPRGSGKPRFAPATPSPGCIETEGICCFDVHLTPHVLPIYQGEDVHERILSFAQSGSRGITVLSCNGSVSRISVCSPGSTGGMIYQGLFEILTLNGTFTCVGNEGSYHRRGMLTVSLAKTNGEVFGGCVSGPIIAAGPIQLILCSFPQLKMPSSNTNTNTQLRNYPVPNFREATPPPDSAAKASDHSQEANQDLDNINSSLKSDPIGIDAEFSVQEFTASKASDNSQELGQDQENINPSSKSDPIGINAEIPPIVTNPEADLPSAPSLVPTPSLQPSADQPQTDSQDQVNTAFDDQ